MQSFFDRQLDPDIQVLASGNAAELRGSLSVLQAKE